MEPRGATGGNRSQKLSRANAGNRPKDVAAGCNQLRKGAHCKGRVDATSLSLKSGHCPGSATGDEPRKAESSADSRGP
jgi:hypothetical protein